MSRVGGQGVPFTVLVADVRSGASCQALGVGGGWGPSTSLCLHTGSVTSGQFPDGHRDMLGSFQWGCCRQGLPGKPRRLDFMLWAVVVTDGLGSFMWKSGSPEQNDDWPKSAGHCPSVPTCPPARHGPLQPTQSPRGLPAASAGTGQKQMRQSALGRPHPQPHTPTQAAQGHGGPGMQEGPCGRAEWAGM